MSNPDSPSSVDISSSTANKTVLADTGSLVFLLAFVGLGVANVIYKDKFTDEIISEARSQLNLSSECVIKDVIVEENWPFPPTISSVKAVNGNLICENSPTKQIFIYPRQRDVSGRMAIVVKDIKE